MLPHLLLVLASLHGTIEAHRFHAHYGSSLLDFYKATFLESFKRGFLYSSFLNAGDTVGASERCVDHLRETQEGLLSMKPWAIKLIDASGEFQSFSSTGNLINLGSYDECLRVVTDQFKGQYCRIQIDFDDSPTQNTSFIPNNAPLVFTFCSPDTCKSSDLANLLTLSNLNATYRVECAESKLEYTTLQIFSICFFIMTAIATILSTTYDVLVANNYEGLNNLLCSFSLKRNHSILIKRDESGIPAINGLRYVCQLIVMFVHYWMHLLKNELPIVNKFEINEITKSWKGSVITNLALTPDVFFSISGFMLSFNFLKNGSQSFNVIHLYALRYIRLFPAYLTVTLFMSTLFDQMCEGPLCSVEVTRNYQICQQYWWANVIGISNIYPGLLKSCLPPGWYVATDMQILILFAPLAMYLMRTSTRAAYFVLMFLTVWSTFATFMISYWNELPLDNFEFDVEKYAIFRTLHSAPYSRVKSWAVGVIIGMYAHSFSRGNCLPCRTFQIVLWLLCGLCVTISTVSILVAHVFDSNFFVAALITSTQGILMSFSTCCIIFACLMKFGGILDGILSWPPLAPLSKISYCLFIAHMPVLYLFFGSVRAPIHLSLATQLPVIVGLYFICHLAAWILFMTVEMPVIHIGAYLFRKK